MAAEPRPLVERRIVSVLFADLVGFTSLSERLDPEDIATLQDAYFAGVRETVTRYGGVLEKFIGDAAMAVFGVPKSRDDDAERAVRAGLALVSVVEGLAARLGLTDTDATLRLRVGVNSGEVVHATDGPDAGRVTGDTVNLAARLQTAAEPNTVLVGELTALSAGEAIELEPVGEIEVKGKAQAVRAFRALAVRAEPSREAALGALRAPLLGRQEELARLTDELGRGGARRWVIIAPPGVGKSRLLAEVASRAERDAQVLRARLRPQVVAPYEAVAQLMRDALGQSGADLDAALARAPVSQGRREVVAREARGLIGTEAGGAREASVQDLSGERDARFAAWLEALEALAGEQESVWVVEDVHWAGGDLLAFLTQAGLAPTAAGRMVIATARPSILESAPEWCSAETATILDLQPLPAVDAAELVRALVGDALPAELVAAIAERSDGNPLFIEELLRTWISVGTLVPAPADGGDDGDGTGWRLSVEPERVALPATVQAIYAAQLDDLAPDARAVARRASVAGRRFSHSALVPLELGELASGLETLRRRAFVAGPKADPIAGDVYAYRHALLRDAGYASLARAERARLHAALARWMEETAGERHAEVAESIGDHYAQAVASLPALSPAGDGLDRRALTQAAASWLERAAEHALSLAAHEAATRLLHRSGELTPDDAPLDAARRRFRLGEVLAHTADLDAGIAELVAARDAFAAHLPDGEARRGYGAATHALGEAWMQQVRFDRVAELMTEALERVGHEQDAVTARLLALRGWAVAAEGIRDGPLEDIAAAMAIVQRSDDPNLELDVREREATVRDEIDIVGPDAWQAIEELALRLGRHLQAVVAMRVRGVLLAEHDLATGRSVMERAAEHAAAHGLTEQQGWVAYSLAEIDFASGAWDEALASAEHALALADRFAYTRLGFRTWKVVLPMAAARRDASLVDLWDAFWQRAAAGFPATPSPYGMALNAGTEVQRAEARGLPLPAPDFDPTAVQPFMNTHYVAALEALTAGWLANGRLADVEALLARQRDDAETGSEPGPLMKASAALAAAWLALARDDAGVAADEARAALGQARSIGAAWWVARTLRALDAAGAASGEEVEEALRIEKRLGVPPQLAPVAPGARISAGRPAAAPPRAG